jgi:hypothetical protein
MSKNQYAESQNVEKILKMSKTKTLTVGNLEVDILTVGNLEVGKITKHRIEIIRFFSLEIFSAPGLHKSSPCCSLLFRLVEGSTMVKLNLWQIF